MRWFFRSGEFHVQVRTAVEITMEAPKKSPARMKTSDRRLISFRWFVRKIFMHQFVADKPSAARDKAKDGDPKFLEPVV